MSVLESAKRVLQIESDSVASLVDRIGPQFEQAVDIIYQCQGRVIVTGIGKSGIVATKIAATLTSTGTAAIFMHPTEGLHGDIGLVHKHDVVICVSKSGNTGEISLLLPLFKRIGAKIITFTGNVRSSLAERSDVVLDVGVEQEACPNNLAPTASTTAAMAMGDALAVALLEKRNFKPEDFCFLHPGGALGKKMLKIDDIMFTKNKIPRVPLQAPFKEVILEISKKRFGCTCVISPEQKLAGIITDGDLRRLLQNPIDVNSLTAENIMNAHPHVVQKGCLASEAMHVLESLNIMQIVIVDEDGIPVGMAHIHDLLEAGIESK